MLPVGMIAALAVAMMDTGGAPPAANVVVETTSAVVETTSAVVETPQIVEQAKTVYTIYGHTPPEEWQRYLYAELDARGCDWYMPYAVCQIWQESCWNPNSTNGIDSGLTQQKEVYWASRAEYWGVPGASIWDPYAQLHVYACQMSQYLSATGENIGMALSLYFYGTGDYAPEYVSHVMSHWEGLEVVR